MSKWLESVKGFLDSHSFGTAVVAAIFVVAAGAGFTAWQWEWLHGTHPATTASTTLRNMGLLIAGGLAIVFAAWRGWVAERQSATAQRQAAISQEQSLTSYQGLLNERYQRGAEMLGSDVLSVRVAGIYALQRLAEEYPEQYHIQIMRFFCAFVRNPPRDDEHQVLYPIGGPKAPGIREDIQATLDAIGNRSAAGIASERKSTSFSIDLERSDLRGAVLEGYDLTGVNLRRANLSGAYMEDIQLAGASLMDANLSGASLALANLSKARLHRANLSNAHLQEANLTEAILNEANLTEARLNSSNLSGAKVRFANLSRASLVQACLSRSDFGFADLSSAELMEADVTDTIFDRTDVSGTFFSNPFLDDYFGDILVTIDASIQGLTQDQLDLARAKRNSPPKLEGVIDANTNKQIAWGGENY